MRLVLLTAAQGLVLCLAVGCSSGERQSSSGDAPTPTRAGTAALKMLCPDVHVLVDSLVASTPDSQREFVVQLERMWNASDQQTRDSLDVLLAAAKRLAKAGVGPGFYAARDGIHTAVVAVNADCVKVGGAPILHSGPHTPA
jgi:hypothetical protein